MAVNTNEKSDIPYVDSRLSKDELANYELSSFENKLEIDGEKYSLYIMDFRKEEPNGEKSKDYPIDFYTMGFMETDPVKPNELSAAVIERAKERGGVLVIPRFENLPNNPASDAEARLTVAGLKQLESKFAESGIDFDLSSRDVDIIGFSDGARSALELAGLIDKVSPKGEPKRTLRSISPTAVIDLIDVPEDADGNELIRGFAKQVTWITLEETRLRINNAVTQEQKRLSDTIFQKMAEGLIIEPERNMGSIVETEKNSRDDEGNYVYPLLVKGFKQIEDPAHAYEPDTMFQVARSVSRLLSYKEGRAIFGEQLEESTDLNIPFLTDVIERAVTSNPKFSVEDFQNGNFVNAVAEGLKVYPNLQHHVKANETRSPICDELSTFDIDVVFPVEDIVFPAEGYGRTIRKKIESGEAKIPYQTSRVVMEQVEHALATGDNEMLGVICARYPQVFERVLFPNAKSVNIRFTGEYGKLSGTHLAPLKKPEAFLN